jgi:radical SAM enzyme (TIGR01210 family)
LSDYPARRIDRDAWVLRQRGPRLPVIPSRAYGYFTEHEPDAKGRLRSISTILLTNRECPWRCVMCDLWQNTLTNVIDPGLIPTQIQHALAQLPPSDQLKLYNSGSFFDPGAIPPPDYNGILHLANRYERLIVECHPLLVTERINAFTSGLTTQLEVAMGLETANPIVLEKLNKGVTLDQFRRASDRLMRHGIALRVFIIVKPPFETDDSAALDWAKRSIDFALDCGATVISVISSRGGNGAMEELSRLGLFETPRLELFAEAFAYGLQQRKSRIFADTWDLPKLLSCPFCASTWADWFNKMNRTQSFENFPDCEVCAGRLN